MFAPLTNYGQIKYAYSTYKLDVNIAKEGIFKRNTLLLIKNVTKRGFIQNSVRKFELSNSNSKSLRFMNYYRKAE